MERIEEVSRALQGSADPLEFVPEIQDLMRSQLDRLQSLQKMHLEGDEAGLASALKSFVSDRANLAEAEKESNLISDVSADFEAMPDLDDLPDSQLVEYLPEPEIWSDMLQGMELAIEALEGVSSVKSKTPTSRERRLNDDAFGRPFEFDSETSQSRFSDGSSGHTGGGGGQTPFSPWSFLNQVPGKAARRAKGKYHGRLPDLSNILHAGHDEHSVRRRLSVRERYERRLQALPVCQPTCTPGDDSYNSCNCMRLKGCIANMTDYDMALLFVEGYVGTDPDSDKFASFTVAGGVNLFDADFDITGKISRIKELATAAETNNYSSESCVDLLSELHTACDPFADSCSGLNSRSYQLSVVSIFVSHDRSLAKTSSWAINIEHHLTIHHRTVLQSQIMVGRCVRCSGQPDQASTRRDIAGTGWIR